MALTRLCGCAGSPETVLFAHVLSYLFTWACSVVYLHYITKNSCVLMEFNMYFPHVEHFEFKQRFCDKCALYRLRCCEIFTCRKYFTTDGIEFQRVCRVWMSCVRRAFVVCVCVHARVRACVGVLSKRILILFYLYSTDLWLST